MSMRVLGIFLILGVLALFGLLLIQNRATNDGKLHVVFCDVGQGDAVYIRTPDGSDMLFDGGPDQKVLQCLAKYMPFWDRHIELVMLSHPHADHLVGILDILDRYTIGEFATEQLVNNTPEYKELEKVLAEKNLAKRNLIAGDAFLIDEVKLSILGPTKEYIARTSPDGLINSSEFASLVVEMTYGDFSVLLTGDSQASGLSKAILGSSTVDVLQVAHHGSKTGLSSEIVAGLKPKLAVISVGRNNYGHPYKGILQLLQASNSVVVRTDREGNIEIVSDGKQWVVR